MKGFAALLIAIILLPACRKDIQNQEAVKQGIVNYLGKRPDLTAMDVTVSGVSFRKDEAEATIYLQAKGGAAAGGGMQMKYLLERKGNEWVVKPHSGSLPGSQNPHGAASPSLPPGHPLVPADPAPGQVR